jgi:hypothetical protein
MGGDSKCADAQRRLGIPLVWQLARNMGWLNYSLAASGFPQRQQRTSGAIADGIPLMVRWGDFLSGKASWSVRSGTFLFCCSWSSRCSLLARRAPTIACANGLPAPFKPTINSRARLTEKQNPIKRTVSWRNSRSPRERPFASCLPHAPVFWIAPLVRGQTSSQIGFALRFFPSALRRFNRVLPAAQFLDGT